MITLVVGGVNDALPLGVQLLTKHGILTDSRNGEVLTLPDPVTTVYERPTERVLFSQSRDANPFFHLLESLWMLSGRNDVAWISEILPSFAQFSDDGKTFHGAYGFRWQRHFHFDQVEVIVRTLRENPYDRRCVLTMWDPNKDLCREGKDFPCNTHIYFSRFNERRALDMTVCCRSNDIIWGAYGANAVHMSILQEYMAAAIGCPMGTYRQISNNYHAYTKTLVDIEDYINPYDMREVKPYPLVRDPERFLQELDLFMVNSQVIGFTEPFFRRVAVPVLEAHMTYRNKDNPNRYSEARLILETCQASDWKRACVEWINRRENNDTIRKSSISEKSR